MLHEGGWTVTGDANGELEFRDRDGRLIDTTRPHERARPILTKQGRDRRKLEGCIRKRVRALRDQRDRIETPAVPGAP